MGHSKNSSGRRRLTLPLPLRAKMIGLAMFIGGFMGLIASAQLDPISARVERVIDGDTIHVRFEGKSYTVRLIGVDTPRRSTHQSGAVFRTGGKRLHQGGRSKERRCCSKRTAPEIP